ncbi:MAG TPA: hypothetical protein VG934_01475 [Candidatus Paceibacterota bacterium]|nr:hypothetical protein [Candidatus Paceibacterota bacterium]
MHSEFKKWRRGVPKSRIPYPSTRADRVKYALWRVLDPLHPYARNALAAVGYMRKYDKYRPAGRQRFVLGALAQAQTPQTLTEYLLSQGFGNHFVALRDKGEIISLRRCPDFTHQYHIRIFEDGEVRGHFEYTPECHPFLHDREIGFEARREEFLALLGDRIIPLEG